MDKVTCERALVTDQPIVEVCLEPRLFLVTSILEMVIGHRSIAWEHCTYFLTDTLEGIGYESMMFSQPTNDQKRAKRCVKAA